MRDAFWIPREDRRRQYERPYLEAPSPFAMPWEPPRSHGDDEEEEEAPRVIVIDI